MVVTVVVLVFRTVAAVGAAVVVELSIPPSSVPYAQYLLVVAPWHLIICNILFLETPVLDLSKLTAGSWVDVLGLSYVLGLLGLSCKRSYEFRCGALRFR